MICEADLGRGRVKGEVVKKNEHTIIMRPVTRNHLREHLGLKETKCYIKRHITKHHVSFMD